MNTEWYYINDLKDFVNSSRRLVFKFFGHISDQDPDSALLDIDKFTQEEKEELEQSLSYEESLSIVKELAKKQKNKKTKIDRYCINDKILQEIIEALNSRLVSNILNNLTNKGVLESGYDAEINDFVFWVKDQEK